MGHGTGLGKVRGLGSTRSGTHHFTTQRLTALSNLALMTWLLVSLVTGDFSSHEALQRWLGNPFAAVPMMLLSVSVFTHLRMGLTVLIEDYQHDDARKLMSLVALQFYSWGGLVFALFCIAKIALGGIVNVGQ